MNNGDTKVTLIMTIGNGAFAVLWLILKLAMRGYSKADLKFVFIFNAILKFLMVIFVAIGDRRQEYMADKFAYENGYGEGLMETLTIFRDMSKGRRLSLKERLRASHPNLKNRLERLGKLQGGAVVESLA